MFLKSQMELTDAHKKSTMYSVRSTSMKRKSLIETVSPEARDFTGAGTPRPQFVLTQPEKADGKASPALVPEPPKNSNLSGRKERNAGVGPTAICSGNSIVGAGAADVSTTSAAY